MTYILEVYRSFTFYVTLEISTTCAMQACRAEIYTTNYHCIDQSNDIDVNIENPLFHCIRSPTASKGATREDYFYQDVCVESLGNYPFGRTCLV